MRLAVTGKNGQVVSALLALASAELEIVALGRPELDLAQPETVLKALRQVKPDAVVSAAAYTAVDKAESEPDIAFAVNRDGARAVAQAASDLGIPLIHLSTDYVFDGAKDTAYVESDPTGPTSVYGRSKLEGERAVSEATDNYVVLRTAWVYSEYGNNFVKTMLRLSENRDEINVVADQFGCPTSANDIAAAVVTIARKLVEDSSAPLRGVFHLSGSGETNWANFAKQIFAFAEEDGGKSMIVNDITTAQYPTPARRPANSRLDCSKLEEVYSIKLQSWQTSTRAVVTALAQSKKETP
ncbi:dTDP-4-dehydrorhamnose reductase [Agrobacterium salinitolerans]|uniref:dTDP-4-dehydrorhamnose reductase n=1 Tax=Agrobacterium salinitolerans TaxID=1183413 RepID=A0A9X3KML1_9HYPH|nr:MULTISPECIES: dTDP-4-dehydrorhamnose reductase [Agrobacterium]MCZ7854078.1 dTDP-4-dehydrorhamnose reductase [Agrobacterium salinitolerans]MCZ7891842.1 dTDP-4-dehydrorhamnose reductase [Agrobacterium salinitolerans]MCZ7937482.1 dTDP-4-dehydrorhamnose reductase [Agrobacterium salinitolerans]MCZ7975563.1 dTDP-4-dehydrorhamnose reductase [Agrobacterium salinitolerans]TRA89446.1 dTDP-4-dehydrorhamnose reductase [Agrobacterium salinitolerans]